MFLRAIGDNGLPLLEAERPPPSLERESGTRLLVEEVRDEAHRQEHQAVLRVGHWGHGADDLEGGGE